MFASVEHCVSDVASASTAAPAAVAAAAQLNDPISLEEIEGAVRKLKLGRMAGPDGLRGELLREVYSVEPVELPNGRHVVKHVYDLSEGSVLHDVWTLFTMAFSKGIPAGTPTPKGG
jgi:hypothetical protein